MSVLPPVCLKSSIFVFPKGTTNIDDFKQTGGSTDMSIDPALK